MGIAIWVLAIVASATQPYGWRPGYVDSVHPERKTEFSELELPNEPSSDKEQLKDVIFDKKLTLEFRARYFERFGQSAAESVNIQPNSEGVTRSAGGETIYFEEENERRRQFGTYMGRRLAEYHIDNYAKNDPDLKPAYELKEKISNVNLEVAKGYSIDGKFSFADQSLSFFLRNPHLDSKVVYDFDPDPKVTGSRPEDLRATIGYPLSKRLYFEMGYSFFQGDTTLVWRRKLRYGWEGSFLLASSPEHELDIPWEQRFIAGVRRSY